MQIKSGKIVHHVNRKDACLRWDFAAYAPAVGLREVFSGGAMVAEGAGPVEIVTALAEDVQKAKQCKSRSASGTPLP